jgi:ATP-dependent Clp protease ATP-binding subunit ClpC
MAIGFKGLLAQAERAARKRGQALTTVHVLLALYQRTALFGLLSEHGISELSLLDAFAHDGSEHATTLALVLERAEKAAATLSHGRAQGPHLLLALTREPRSSAYRCIERLGVSPAQLQQAVLALLDGSARPRAAERVQAGAAVQARNVVRAQPSTRSKARHRLNAQQRLASETERRRVRDRDRRQLRAAPSEAEAESDSPAEAAAWTTRAPSDHAGEAAARHAKPRRASADRASAPGSAPASSKSGAAFALDAERFPLLSSLGRNLCAAAAEGRVDPVLGREAEIEQVLDVLARRRANNPLLVGPPGVGKTAIVEGVAHALVRAHGQGARRRILCELPASALVAGTSVRGALSERLGGIVKELSQAHGEVILFIDEAHGVVGADDGADSIAFGIKTALARGELPCIGATTESEYRRVFERDAALARRFTRIEVEEPSPAVALAILRGLALEYEKHHGVAYEPAALAAAVEMSVRFIHERQLPDKAISVIDQAAARVQRRGGSCVSVQSVAEVVSEHSGVPVERLLMRDAEALLALDARLGERVIGQPEAIAVIADALRKGAAGFRGERPLATFLFLGSTGVGKTEMAKAIAEQLFPASEITRLDMSELSEAHAVARLIGAPPGYVGYEEGGQLTEAVRARPYQLVLLDEVEKAHRDVWLALLPLLDEGRLSDSRGRTVSFRNTVIVMTSNLGAEALDERGRVGFGAESGQRASQSTRVLLAAKRALPPELWNRIDEPLFFAPLDRDAVARIARRMVNVVAAVLQREHGVAIEVEASAIETLIAAGGYDASLGARPMRRTVARLLEAKLARAILAGEFKRGELVVARGLRDQIVLDRGPNPAPTVAATPHAQALPGGDSCLSQTPGA